MKLASHVKPKIVQDAECTLQKLYFPVIFYQHFSHIESINEATLSFTPENSGCYTHLKVSIL